MDIVSFQKYFCSLDFSLQWWLELLGGGLESFDSFMNGREELCNEKCTNYLYPSMDNLQTPSSLYFPAYDYAYAQGLCLCARTWTGIASNGAIFNTALPWCFNWTPKRIIRCGGAVDDDMANIIVAQLLYLETRSSSDSLELENKATNSHWRGRLHYFAWLELMSHKSFMPKLLIVNPPKGWPHVQCLLVDLFKFMEPYPHSAELGETIHVLFKGILMVLLVLLHDFPEFLCDYHFSFCDVIPSSCIQMRNVIHSAFYLDCIFFRKELFLSF
ncbi:hypothetical protein ACSBR1_016726 [Camellia fascicularis]